MKCIAPPLLSRAALGVVALSLPALPQDWTNAGGNPQRNGQFDGTGPIAADFLWSSGPATLIGWQPVTAANRAFCVRQSGFATSEPGASPVVAYDLDTGAVLWTRDVPFEVGDWTTWLAGTSNGLVYAARGGNGDTSDSPLFALDQGTGATVWESDALVSAGPYDGVVFADNGDPIVAWQTSVVRIDAATGATVWQSARQGSVTGSCGGAIFEDALYLVDIAPGGQVVKRFDLATGAFEYAGPLMGGFLVQSTPMVTADGAVVFSRTQNNPLTDFLYLFDDDGTAITERWSVETGWTTSSEFAVGVDGSIYAMSPNYEVVRRDPATGAILDTSIPLPTGGYATRMATDRDGRLFLTSGSTSTSELYVFEEDLELRYSIAAPSTNVGAPALCEGGTLVIAGRDSVETYRSPSPFTDLGFALASSSGTLPELVGEGTLTPGKVALLEVSSHTPSAPLFLVAGGVAAFVPLAVGTLVPAPDVIQFLGTTDALGAFGFSAKWPAAATPGTPIVLQAWSLDLASPALLAATNGLSGIGS